MMKRNDRWENTPPGNINGSQRVGKQPKLITEEVSATAFTNEESIFISPHQKAQKMLEHFKNNNLAQAKRYLLELTSSINKYRISSSYIISAFQIALERRDYNLVIELQNIVCPPQREDKRIWVIIYKEVIQKYINVVAEDILNHQEAYKNDNHIKVLHSFLQIKSSETEDLVKTHIEEVKNSNNAIAEIMKEMLLQAIFKDATNMLYYFQEDLFLQGKISFNMLVQCDERYRFTDYFKKALQLILEKRNYLLFEELHKVLSIHIIDKETLADITANAEIMQTYVKAFIRDYTDQDHSFQSQPYLCLMRSLISVKPIETEKLIRGYINKIRDEKTAVSLETILESATHHNIQKYFSAATQETYAGSNDTPLKEGSSILVNRDTQNSIERKLPIQKRSNIWKESIEAEEKSENETRRI